MTALTTRDAYAGMPVPEQAMSILTKLFDEAEVPPEVQNIARATVFTGTSEPILPLPHKHFAIAAALQGLFGAFASHILATRTDKPPATVSVNADHAGLSLAGLMLVQVDGKPLCQALKQIPKVPAEDPLWYLPIKSLVSSVYRCADGAYFHPHGSLNPRFTIAAMGIDPDLDADQQGTRDAVQAFVGQRSAAEMLQWSMRLGIPGDVCLKPEEFDDSDHGRVASAWKLVTPHARLEDFTLSVPLSKGPDVRRPLDGIKVRCSSASAYDYRWAIMANAVALQVVEMTRVLAGPAIGRHLAELGATVVRFIAPTLPDYGFYFQPDCNLGKRAVHIDLRTERGKAQLRHLLQDADVFVHGYRPGVIERLGFGSEVLNQIAVKRGKGFVIVSENTYGHEGPWAWRPGFQQIADVVSGLAWETGEACGQDMPIVPCWPITDYCTGIMGAIAVLQGLLKRARLGGSWHAPVSLLQYTLFARKQGQYPHEYVRALHAAGPRHTGADAMPAMTAAQIAHLQEDYPGLFDPSFFETSGSSYGTIRHLKRVVRFVQDDEVPSGFGYSPAWGESKVGWNDDDAEVLEAELQRAGL
ncbi:CoA-transferase family III [Gloeophyllum trabeum ATCC 11539]|uniref:CoA-transferase family III n=1 Tax=Gloeophyllum trabeum (strain ATCC 11539 / FP-39264 / Madison 617) TaxID=670483 RepID=S7RLJ1_GLOTA|nr:CoA-transferase family III [Gloeophyllum trabeum ATCC 11539]EPQ55275.1 CoA-transferase family III [Gloeophyllum trabeum ATCC 11539]